MLTVEHSNNTKDYSVKKQSLPLFPEPSRMLLSCDCYKSLVGTCPYCPSAFTCVWSFYTYVGSYFTVLLALFF